MDALVQGCRLEGMRIRRAGDRAVTWVAWARAGMSSLQDEGREGMLAAPVCGASCAGVPMRQGGEGCDCRWQRQKPGLLLSPACACASVCALAHVHN